MYSKHKLVYILLYILVLATLNLLAKITSYILTSNIAIHKKNSFTVNVHGYNVYTYTLVCMHIGGYKLLC